MTALLCALCRMARNVCWSCAVGRHGNCTGHCDCADNGHMG